MKLTQKDDNVNNIANRNGKKIIKKVKDILIEKGIEIQMKKVLKTKNGKIIIETKNIQEDKLVPEAIKSNEFLNIKNESKKNPCIIITGIDTGYNKDEFIEELLKENKDLANLIKN